MNEQQLRSVIRQILKENQGSAKILQEYGTEYRGLLKHLTDPFKDVAKAFALTGQDILNSLGLMFDTLTTLSPKKLKKAREEYKKRNAEIGKKWEPIMAASKEALTKGDLGLILFAISPAEVIGYQLGKGLVKSVKNIPTYLRDAGWEIPFLSALGILPPKGEKEREEKRSTKTTQVKKPLRARLNNIFYGSSDYDYGDYGGYGGYGGYGESISHSENIISEEDKKNEKMSPQDFSKQLQDYFKAVGLDVELDKLYDGLYDSKKIQVDEIMKDVNDQLEILKRFSNAKLITDFDDIVKIAKSKNIDVSVLEKKLSDLKTGLEKKAADLKKQLESDKTKKMSSEQIDDAVKEAAKNAASQALEELVSSSKESLEKSLVEMRKQVEETLTADWPDDKAAARSQLSKTAQGKKYLELIDGALNSITQTKETT